MRRMSREQVERELSCIVASLRRYGPQRVILFGSFARGDDHAFSDIDLLIIKQTDRPFVERIGDVLALCEHTISLEPLVYTPEEFEAMRAAGNPFIERVLEERIVLYES
jgi:predicted nucleotidyltransferase